MSLGRVLLHPWFLKRHILESFLSGKALKEVSKYKLTIFKLLFQECRVPLIELIFSLIEKTFQMLNIIQIQILIVSDFYITINQFRP